MRDLSATAELTRDLLARVESIRADVGLHPCAGESERERTDLVQVAIRQKGLYAMLLPQALGGLEAPPTVTLTVLEALARIDSSASWNLGLSGAGLARAAYLPETGIGAVFGGGEVPAFAGAGFPPGSAIRADGGYRVSGQVSFASGCRHADWLFFPALVSDEQGPIVNAETGRPGVIMAFFPRNQIEIIDTWHVMGMQGTQSSDIRASNVFVPESLAEMIGSHPQTARSPAFSGPLYQMDAWIGINSETAVALGIASAAIDSLIELAATKMPAMSAVPLRDRELIQANAGKARSLLESARYYLHGAATQAYEILAAGEQLGAEMKTSLQLANCHAAEASARAVDLVFESAGSSAIRTELPFERYFRDVHVITTHTTKSAMRYASAGKLMFGLPTDAPHLQA